MENEEVIVNDTLIFKYNEFFELSNKINEYNIKEIEFQTSGCFGTCPIFNLKIDHKGNAKFSGQANIKYIGKSEFKLPLETFNLIKKMLEYINIRELENNYAVPWSDDQTGNLKIVFKDDSTKIIKDYGLLGTFGLKAVYDKLTEVAEQTKWKK